MCKRDYKIADFVLDPEFQKWVLNPDAQTKKYWEKYLNENPKKEEDIAIAIKIVANMSRNSSKVSSDKIEETWSNIEQAIGKTVVKEKNKNTVPLNAVSTVLKFRDKRTKNTRVISQFYRLVGILAIIFFLAILVNIYLPSVNDTEIVEEVEMLEHYAPPGVKANLSLKDGSKVVLNSGSTLRYIKNFESNRRVLELTGEAYFEVAEDKARPFSVKTGAVTTTALGTTFHISSYDDEPLDIALISGKVAVDIKLNESRRLNLEKGQGLEIDLSKDEIKSLSFDSEKLLGWTRKVIIFDEVSMFEIKRVLENWYGVNIDFINRPASDLEISGRFKDQSLENVLEGLSHSARFEYKLEKNKATLKFH
ncbi:FecR family protein [Cyclobacterium marinum]|uniref:Anti-FecI sigma factor, FecR n=1 Tax=Cyclobacterium marinum (strain ATCC 25205 / DSM 745 / LMG 13164 / NCIMB 1802) TaxID=880070 RepID=G0J5G2_CYCMS|nr:FecR domain-containing protein [Cyclobacterium marinum]AEL27598.1 anti-FecI sigma factor, FecR [Cyclobacterium marinum DSM 745]